MMSSLPECKTKDPPKFLSSWLGVHVIGGIFISVNNFTGLTVASFFWKPELSEVPGYGGARFKAVIEFVEKYIISSGLKPF